MDIAKTKEILAGLHEPAYRLAQAKRAYYSEFLTGWDRLNTYPSALRAMMSEQAPWDELILEKTVKSRTGDSVKALFRCGEGETIEAVLMQHEGGRNTVCVSSQVGCPMACAFCATGKLGFKRNLTRSEIAEQVVHFARLLAAEDAKVTNIVFMGMGEPFANYDEALGAAHILNDSECFGLGARHLTISTCGIVPGILKLAKEPLQINLAISLHAATDELRTKLMPVNKAYPLEKLMAAVREYAEATNRKVFFEYLLIKGVNDGPKDAEDLAELLDENPRLYHVNLIKYHDTGDFEASGSQARSIFMDRLKQRGIVTTMRVSFGEDIDAACGQLAAKGSKV